MPKDSLHLDKVNYTLEVELSTDRNYYGAGVSTKNGLHLVYHAVEVSTLTVHLIYISDTGYVVLISLAPYSL